MSKYDRQWNPSLKFRPVRSEMARATAVCQTPDGRSFSWSSHHNSSFSRYDRLYFFFFSSRRRHTRCSRDWSSDVCSSDLPISIQYPIIEASVGLLWVVALLYYGFTMHALAAAIFGTILVGIGVIDARHKIIPDELSVSGLVLGLALSLSGGLPGFLQALLGAAVGWSVLWVVRELGGLILRQEAMGWGDIKMLAMVGAFVGWKNAVLTIFVGAIIGAGVYLPLMVWSIRKWRRDELPIGVFLGIAAAIKLGFRDTR